MAAPLGEPDWSNALLDEHARIMRYWRMYQFVSTDDDARLARFQNFAPGFMAQTKRLLSDAITLHLVRLVDGRKDTLTFDTIIEELRKNASNNKLFHEFDDDSMSEKVSEYKRCVEKIKAIRNKEVAHNDRDVATWIKAPPQRAQFTDIERAIELLGEIAQTVDNLIEGPNGTGLLDDGQKFCDQMEWVFEQIEFLQWLRENEQQMNESELRAHLGAGKIVDLVSPTRL